MSSEPNFDKDGFQKVSYKKRGRRTYSKNAHAHVSQAISLLESDISIPFDLSKSIRRVNKAIKELLSTDYYDSLLDLLRQGLEVTKLKTIQHIVCLGLGNVTIQKVSRFQFALLLCLQDMYDVKDVQIYDPLFNDNDKMLIEAFDISIDKHNRNGKYTINSGDDTETTLFYLPHCPRGLVNNLLGANWDLNLCRCVILSNNMFGILENTKLPSKLKAEVDEKTKYISRIFPYTLELEVINNFWPLDVFNSLSLQFFPLEKLNKIPETFWREHKETFCDGVDLDILAFQIKNTCEIAD